jgi:hypothetical protein
VTRRSPIREDEYPPSNRITTQTMTVFQGLRDVKRARPAVENESNVLFPSNVPPGAGLFQLSCASIPVCTRTPAGGVLSKLVARVPQQPPISKQIARATLHKRPSRTAFPVSAWLVPTFPLSHADVRGAA